MLSQPLTKMKEEYFHSARQIFKSNLIKLKLNSIIN